MRYVLLVSLIVLCILATSCSAADGGGGEGLSLTFTIELANGTSALELEGYLLEVFWTGDDDGSEVATAARTPLATAEIGIENAVTLELPADVSGGSLLTWAEQDPCETGGGGVSVTPPDVLFRDVRMLVSPPEGEDGEAFELYFVWEGSEVVLRYADRSAEIINTTSPCVDALDRTLAIDLALLEGWNPVASSVSPLPIAPLLTLTERELRTVPWDEFLDGVVARLRYERN
jgi:hypothetical protein